VVGKHCGSATLCVMIAGATIQVVVGTPLSNGSEMSAFLYACFEGLVLPTLVDPDFDLEGAYRVLDQIAKQFVQSQLTSEGK